MPRPPLRITSKANRYVKEARSLRHRRTRARSGTVLLEGTRLVVDALESGVRCKVAFYTPAAVVGSEGRGVLDRIQAACPRALEVTEEVFASFSNTETPQGFAMMVEWPVWELPRLFTASEPWVLVADGIKDPGNLGTMVRTAAAAGASGVAVTGNSVDLTNPKVLRAGMGASFRIPCVQDVQPDALLSELVTHNIRLYVADASGDTDLYAVDWTGALALVVGSEAHGPDPRFHRAARGVIRVPMPGGIDSLNASITAALCLYEGVRQRRRTG